MRQTHRRSELRKVPDPVLLAEIPRALLPPVAVGLGEGLPRSGRHFGPWSITRPVQLFEVEHMKMDMMRTSYLEVPKNRWYTYVDPARVDGLTNANPNSGRSIGLTATLHVAEIGAGADVDLAEQLAFCGGQAFFGVFFRSCPSEFGGRDSGGAGGGRGQIYSSCSPECAFPNPQAITEPRPQHNPGNGLIFDCYSLLVARSETYCRYPVYWFNFSPEKLRWHCTA